MLLAGEADADRRRTDMANAQRPYEQYLADSQVLQTYIPGLHRPGENFPQLPEPRPSSARPKMVPEQLIKDYRSGAKNEISAIFEYGAILKVKVEFREVAVADRQAGQFSFACECVLPARGIPKELPIQRRRPRL